MIPVSGTEVYYRNNAQGTAVATRNGTGTLLSKSEFDGYGKEYMFTAGYKSDFRFVGKAGYVTDDDLGGVDFLGSRHYIPTLGRFMNQDPIGQNGGVNLYVYCSNNPLMNIDPTGHVVVKLISYRVFGTGWHRGIVVEDNVTHKGAYSFAGGPQKFDVMYPGPLVSKSGPWVKGTMDFDFYHSHLRDDPTDVRVITLLNDSSNYDSWVNRFKAIERDIQSHTPQLYDPLGGAPPPEGPFGANSNSSCRYLLEKGGLMWEYYHATSKLGFLDRMPWAPGWNHIPPYKQE